MADIRTKPATDLYRKNFNEIFRKKPFVPPPTIRQMKFYSLAMKKQRKMSGIMPVMRLQRPELRGNEEAPFYRMPYPDRRKVKFDSKNYGTVAIKTGRTNGKNKR